MAQTLTWISHLNSYYFSIPSPVHIPYLQHLIILIDNFVTFVHKLSSKASFLLLGGDAQKFWCLREGWKILRALGWEILRDASTMQITPAS